MFRWILLLLVALSAANGFPSTVSDSVGPATSSRASPVGTTDVPAAAVHSTASADGGGDSHTTPADPDHGPGDGHGHASDSPTHEKESYPVIKLDFIRVATPFIICAWVFLSGIAKIGFHVSPKLSSICPESCMLIVLGLFIGLALYYTGATKVAPLTPDIFFLFMLPPIVMDAGYFMPNRRFFDNLGAILLFAVLGTIWNSMSIGISLWATGITGLFGVELTLLECLLFSSLISAVDPVAVLAVFEEIHVNEVLYILVFGESLLNDAVTVVLYHMFETYVEMEAMHHTIEYIDVMSGVGNFLVVSLGGTIIGVIWGLLSSFVTRFTHHVRVIEPLFVIMMAYLSYLTAEIFHMSGILAITFCGITMKNYVEANISQKSHTTVKYTMKMLANASETIIFLFLGISTITDIHAWNTWFVFFTILYCSVFRTIGVGVLTSFCNRSRVNQITKVDEFVMAYGGLRGAVAFALVVSIADDVTKHKNMMITTCIAVVYFTVFVQGITIGPLVQFLGVKRSSKKKPSMNERIHIRFIDHLMAGIEEITGNVGNHHIRDKFKFYNNKYFRHWFTRDVAVKEPKILETYSKLNVKDALDMANSKSMMLNRMNTEMNLASIFKSYTLANLQTSQSSASFNDLSSPNIDLHHLEYSPGGRDLDDVKLHHVLSEAMFKPVHEHQKYKKYDVCDWSHDHPPFHHKMRMQIRQFVSDNHRHQKHRSGRHRSNNGLKPPNPKAVTFRGNSDAVNKKNANDLATKNMAMDKITEDDPDEGITFSVGAGDRNSKASNWSTGSDGEGGGSDSTVPADYNDQTEDFRQRNFYYNNNKTIAESVLPWKRDDDTCPDSNQACRQQEFPAWVDNMDYTSYQSPTATYLGGINKDPDKPPVTQIFGGSFESLDSPIINSNEVPASPEIGLHNPAFSDDEGLEMNEIAESEQSAANNSANSEHLTYL